MFPRKTGIIYRVFTILDGNCVILKKAEEIEYANFYDCIETTVKIFSFKNAFRARLCNERLRRSLFTTKRYDNHINHRSFHYYKVIWAYL